MKIKLQLTLGVGLLFTLIILQGVVSVREVHLLAADTSNILTDNYNSLEFSRNMLSALESPDTAGMQWAVFEKNLRQQEQNITETGEREFTETLRRDAVLLQQHPNNATLRNNIRNGIYSIMKVNQEAIQRKSQQAGATARDAIFWLSCSATFCFIIAFILLFNLPESIAGPIRELSQRIRQIAAGDYTQRVQFRSGSEFGELAASFNTMAEKLEEYNNSSLAQIMTEKKRIETLINNMHDPVIGLDEHKKIVFANEEAIKIIGLRENAVLGASALDLAVINDLMRSLIQPLISGAPDTGKAPLKIFANGKESYFDHELIEIVITPTGEQAPRHIGHVILLRNITGFVELDMAKTNFIATVSHEFKTPIAAIGMSLQLLQNGSSGALNQEQQRLLSGIQDDTQRLLRFTRELLDITQVESGKIQLNIQACAPQQIVGQAIEASATRAAQKGIRISTQMEPELPQVWADPEKMTLVLSNLIANAIQYSFENGQVEIRATQRDGQVHFSVHDHGQGIAASHLHRIFDRYFRVPGTNTEGTGLGLAICKQFVELQGGQISAESELGAGSVFTVAMRRVA
jgi:two-component system, NtrC family, sensor histidine kinase KinB